MHFGYFVSLFFLLCVSARFDRDSLLEREIEMFLEVGRDDTFESGGG